MKKKSFALSFLSLLPCLFLACHTAKTQSTVVQTVSTEFPKDSVAERMLLYQRDNGGWPQPGGDAINYSLIIKPELRKKLLSEKKVYDTTIDDKATTREIATLVKAYSQTQNSTYLQSAERGIKYLLEAQNKAGGWGQFYPDSSGYHKHITYNDNAMIDVMKVMRSTAEAKDEYANISPALRPLAQLAVDRGVRCILNTQVRQNGILTVWCAQHDRLTLKPAKARKFELPSLSGAESVGIINFLMAIKNPSDEIKQSIKAAVAYLESVKIKGIKVEDIPAPSLPKGKDRVVIADPNGEIWARFYDLETNKPFFVGRDSVPKVTLAEIEHERRIGYGYYGEWPKKLIEVDYPKWLAKWNK
jgi:PelA/Pel-15E family pectate lyase